MRLLAKAPGIDFNLHPSGVQPAAIMAMASDRSDIVDILTQTEIDWNYQDGMRQTAVFAGINNRSYPSLELVTGIDSIDWNITNCIGRTPLLIAVELSDIRSLELLRQVPSINWNYINKYQSAYEKCDDSAVTLALNQTSEECFQYLLTVPEVKVDIEHLKNRGLFRKAVVRCKEFVSKDMINNDSGPDINATQVYQYLIFALKRNMTSSVVSLLVSDISTWDIVDLINYRQSTLFSPSLNPSSDLKRAATKQENEIVLKKLRKT